MVITLRVPKKRSAWAYLNPLRKAIALYALVPSFTEQGKSYTVLHRKNILGSSYSCDCKDFLFRQRDCKHIRSVKDQEHAGTSPHS